MSQRSTAKVKKWIGPWPWHINCCSVSCISQLLQPEDPRPPDLSAPSATSLATDWVKRPFPCPWLGSCCSTSRYMMIHVYRYNIFPLNRLSSAGITSAELHLFGSCHHAIGHGRLGRTKAPRSTQPTYSCAPACRSPTTHRHFAPATFANNGKYESYE